MIRLCRRTLLQASAGLASVSLAGCTGRDDGSDEKGNPTDDNVSQSPNDGESQGSTDDQTEVSGASAEDATDTNHDTWQYGQCTGPLVHYDNLPKEIRGEVDIAFDEGQYTTEGELLYQQAVGPDTPLLKDDTYYDHEVTDEGDERHLSFERRTVHPTPRKLWLVNESDTAITATLSVLDDAGDPVVATNDVQVEPDESNILSGPRELGEYHVEIELEDGRTQTGKWEITPSPITTRYLHITISEDGITISPLVLSLDYRSCPQQWGDDEE